MSSTEHKGKATGESPLALLIARSESVLEAASPRLQMAFGAVMWQLVRGASADTVPETVALIEKSAFRAESPADALLKMLAVCGCVAETTDQRGKAAWALAFAALMTDWPRLREFIRTNAALLELRNAIAPRAAEWEAHGGLRQGLIPPGPELEACRELLDLMRDRLLRQEREFLEASLAEEDRQLSKHWQHRLKKRLRPVWRFMRTHPGTCVLGVAMLVLWQVWSFLPIGSLWDLLHRIRKDFSGPSQSAQFSVRAAGADARRGLRQLKKPKDRSGLAGDGDEEELSLGASGKTTRPAPSPPRPSAEELARKALKLIESARKAGTDPGAAARKLLWQSLSMGMDQGPLCTAGVVVEAAAFSPSEDAVLTGDREGWLRVWTRSPEGRVLERRRSASGLDGIAFLCSARDGTVAAVGPTGGFRLFDAAGRVTGEAWKPSGASRFITCAAFSADGSHLAVAGVEGRIRLSSTAEPLAAVQLEAAVRPIVCLALTGDGTRLACGSTDGEVEIWDTRERFRSSALQVGSRVLALSFAGGGERLMAVGADGTHMNWRVDSPGDNPRQMVGKAALSWASFDGPPGTLYAVGDDGLRVTDLEGHALQAAVPLPDSPGRPMAVSRDGRWLVRSAPGEGPRLVAVDGPTLPTRALAPGSPVHAVAFDLAGERLVTAQDDLTVQVWDRAGNPQGPRLQGLRTPADRVGFTTSGANVVASCGQEMRLYSWRLASSTLVTVSCDFAAATTRGGPASAGGLLRLAPGRRHVATALAGTGPRVWDLGGHPVCALQVVGAPTFVALEFDREGSRVAAVGKAGQVKVWDLSGRLVLACPAALPRPTALAWNLEGTLVALAGTGGGFVWELRSNGITGRWESPAGPIDGLAFHPSEPLLATRARSGETAIRTVEGELAAPLSQGAATGPARSRALPAALAFSPDGRLLARVCGNGTVRFQRCGLEDGVRAVTRRLRHLEGACAKPGATDPGQRTLPDESPGLGSDW